MTPTPVTLTKPQWHKVWRAAALRQVDSLGGTDKHGATRASLAERQGRAVIGAAGEQAAALVLGLPWAGTWHAPKSEPDIFPDVQVRTRAYMGYDLCIGPDDPVEHRYVLVLTSREEWPTLYVAGYVWGHDRARLGVWSAPWGGSDKAWVIPRARLAPIPRLGVRA